MQEGVNKNLLREGIEYDTPRNTGDSHLSKLHTNGECMQSLHMFTTYKNVTSTKLC